MMFIASTVAVSRIRLVEPQTTLEPQMTLKAVVPDWPQQTLLPQSTAEAFTSVPPPL